MYFEPQGTFYERFVFLEEKVVGIRSVDPPDLVYVAEASATYTRSGGSTDRMPTTFSSKNTNRS